MLAGFVKFIFIVFLLTGFFWIFIHLKNQESSSYYLSPVPDYLTLGKNNQVTLLDLWLPFFDKPEVQGIDTLASTPIKSGLTAKSVLMYGLTSDKVLFEKNPS